MFNWFNNTQSAAPAAVQNPATTAGAAVNGAAAPTTSTNWMGVQVEPMTGTTGGFSGRGFAGNVGMILGGVQALGNLWNSYQQNKLAKQQFAFQKEAFQTNLANQTQTYNTALEDRIRARYHTEGRSSGEADQYLEEHSL
ncbi:virion protein [Roseobacter phage RD-1410W1-01]|uniref:Virion protein n=1 Tax=Roseobacter phage RD-1410W1-01 TaxID=1815984 RepID=A0A191VYL3_9CAUD|nr:virion protein [Roseobacter phage RD-1410W1-01]ANJ20800.1 virion protein [Roseobacter phage RD-1410W1-01]